MCFLLPRLLPSYSQERLKKLKKEHGSLPLGNVTLDMVIGGMRGITVRFTKSTSHFKTRPLSRPFESDSTSRLEYSICLLSHASI